MAALRARGGTASTARQTGATASVGGHAEVEGWCHAKKGGVAVPKAGKAISGC